MPTRAQILHATPICNRARPYQRPDGTSGYKPCREFLRWYHTQEYWSCRHHGAVLSVQAAVDQLKVPA